MPDCVYPVYRYVFTTVVRQYFYFKSIYNCIYIKLLISFIFFKCKLQFLVHPILLKTYLKVLYATAWIPLGWMEQCYLFYFMKVSHFYFYKCISSVFQCCACVVLHHQTVYVCLILSKISIFV